MAASELDGETPEVTPVRDVTPAAQMAAIQECMAGEGFMSDERGRIHFQASSGTPTIWLTTCAWHPSPYQTATLWSGPQGNGTLFTTTWSAHSLTVSQKRGS